MNKSELVHALAAVTETTQDSAAKNLDALLRILSDELSKGGEVALAGFGSFRQAERSERAGRNPKTGEAITIAASKTVKFVPATALKSAVNGSARG